MASNRAQALRNLRSSRPIAQEENISLAGGTGQVVAGVAWPRQARCTRRLEPWNPREVRADVPLRPSGHAELEEQVPEPSRPGGLL